MQVVRLVRASLALAALSMAAVSVAAVSVAAVSVSSSALAAEPKMSPTLKAVRERGVLVCGVNQGLPGFSTRAEDGSWSGFDVDFCRAVAAAIFDDPAKVRYVPLDAEKRFAALASGEIDILSRNSTWTLGREIAHGIVFPAVTYYDGQGFMVRTAQPARSPLEFGGMKVCVQDNTTTASNAAAFFAANGVDAKLITSPDLKDAVKAYEDGRCDAFTSDVSQLHALRSAFAAPAEHAVLPDVISKEPLGPAVRQGDEGWALIAQWVHFAMVDAEEIGVDSQRIDQALASKRPAVRRLVGTDGHLGEGIGLSPDWAVRIVRRVGNYGEVFERNVGAGTKLGIPRGLNALWNAGGIQYAPPVE